MYVGVLLKYLGGSLLARFGAILFLARPLPIWLLLAKACTHACQFFAQKTYGRAPAMSVLGAAQIGMLNGVRLSSTRY